ncbi:hypothetical protein [Acinetobacter brisouii]
MLKNCDECGKSYSDKANSCVHCGAPNQIIEEDKENENSIIWIIIIAVFTFLMLAKGPEVRDFFLNIFNQGIITKEDVSPCENNNRVNLSIKELFDGSQYALSQSLKAVSVNAETRPTSDGSLSTCAAKLQLNNGKSINILVDFKEENGNIMIYSQPDTEADLKDLGDYISKNKDLI